MHTATSPVAALLLLVGLLAQSQSATSTSLSPPVWRITGSLLPNTPPRPMRVPPPRVDVCSEVTCPRAPNQCFFGEQS